MNGILLLNKPLGMSSNVALQKAKRLFGAKKAGHTGTLDPLATGMLPICFNEATKISPYLLSADKCYETIGLLGIKTNTADSTGEIIASIENFDISQVQLENSLLKFRGHIRQVPSMFSALKHKGKALYHYARQGIEIERKPRDVFIKELKLVSYDGRKLALKVSCEKGTYIRNLIEDIGNDLGVGAHVIQLHRVHTLGFENKPMYSLEELENFSMDQKLDCLIPMDKAVDYLPKINLEDNEVIKLRQGLSLLGLKNNIFEDCVRLYDKESHFIGLGEQDSCGNLKAKRLLSF